MGPIKLKNVSQKLTSYIHELKGSQSALKKKEVNAVWSPGILIGQNYIQSTKNQFNFIEIY